LSIKLYLCPTSESDNIALPVLYAQLRAEDRARADRFVVLDARRQFILAHCALDLALKQAGLDRQKITTTHYGKPYLPDHPSLHFNLSHTKSMIAVALTRDAEIGVDVEHRPNELHSLDAISTRVFTPAERAAMRNDRDPVARFTQLWSAKEAIMKATGLGFHLPPLEIDLQGPEPRLIGLPPKYGAPSQWWLQTENLGDTWLALAAQHPVSQVEQKKLTAFDLILN
jgi:4'-phosphopantetheinyl transferase